MSSNKTAASMHTLQCKAPSPHLRRFVRTYAQREIRDIDGIIKEPVPARLEQTLEFQLGETFDTVSGNGHHRIAPSTVVVGAHIQSGFTILLEKNVLSFAIFFQPNGLSRLFRFPAAELSHQAFAATDVFGAMIASFHCRLGECESFAQRVAVAEEFLGERAMGLPSCGGSDSIEKAVARIFLRHGVLRVADAAHDAGLSVRQFERKFLRQTGILPKTFARVARFQTALDAKILSPKVTWLDIAHDLGYHDQMHMVRDFHDLAGGSPGTIFASIGDGRPPAMGELSTL
jgi:AraC-like DNA-binding protein